MIENELATLLVDLFLKIRRKLGPGLLESVYEEVICHELKRLGVPFKRQQAIRGVYDGIEMELGFRADVIVDNKVLIEIKSIESIAPVHQKVVLTYLKLSGVKLGLLVNFNVELIRNGIQRIVNNL